MRLNNFINIKFLLLIIGFTTQVAKGQKSNSKILDFETFALWVLEHHPLSFGANLQMGLGDAEVQSARGNFDPNIYSTIYDKYFDNRTYFQQRSSGLKIPTWYGIEAQVNYQQNSGLNLNPEEITPNSGLIMAGISIPLGKNLFLDKRRAELQKAKLFKESTIAERKNMLNNLLLSAGQSYWDWFSSYHALAIHSEAWEAAKIRKAAVLQSVNFGDRPAIDTVEASIQVQNRSIRYLNAQLEYKNNSQLLSIYLWKDGATPMKLTDSIKPIDLNTIDTFNQNYIFQKNVDSLLKNHPILTQSRLNIKQNLVNQRLAAEQLKPDLRLKYNALIQPLGGNTLNSFNNQNYIWGLDFGLPIFLRKERGKLTQSKIEVKQAQYDLLKKEAMINYKISASLNEWKNSQDLLGIYSKTVNDYSTLLKGERKRFDGGESSLFMVNSRELGYINSQIQYTKMVAKTHQFKLRTIHALGILYKMDNP